MGGWRKPALFVPLCALLTGCATQSNYAELQARYAQTQATNQKLQAENQALQAELSQQPASTQERTYTIAADMLFAPHGVSLSASGQAALNDIAARLHGPKSGKITVYGYTDNENVGPPLKKMGINNNMELSSKRADIVADYLRAHGVNPALISAKGRGEANPVAPNDTPADRARNRRVEIVVDGAGG